MLFVFAVRSWVLLWLLSGFCWGCFARFWAWLCPVLFVFCRRFRPVLRFASSALRLVAGSALFLPFFGLFGPAVFSVVASVWFCVLLCLFCFWALGWLFLLAVRRFCFLRFPRPCSRLGWSFFAWRCVPASALPGLCASVVVASVRPAVLCRLSGSVLAFWVLVPVGT